MKESEVWQIAIVVTLFSWFIAFMLLLIFWESLCEHIAVTILEQVVAELPPVK